jgi:hypothetical protein
MGLWGSMIDEPVDFLTKLDHPNAQQILNVESAARFDKAMWLDSMRDVVKEVDTFLAKDFKKYDKLFYDLASLPPSSPEFVQLFRTLNPDERNAYRAVRRAFDTAWDELHARGYIDMESPGYIHGYAPLIFPVDGDVALGVTPWDLQDMPVSGNAMFRHLLHRTGHDAEPIESITQTMQAYMVGAARKMFDEPSWKQMMNLSGIGEDAAAKDFPMQARSLVEEWIRAKKGYPSKAEAAVESGMRSARRMEAEGLERAGAEMGQAGRTLAAFISNMMYKGFLMGSPHYWLQNFMTQGVLNPMAKHGPFRWLRGISSHYMDAAFRKTEPQAALLGGFHAMFRDMPLDANPAAREMAERWGNTQGGRTIRRLFDWMENTIGVTQVEMQMRGIAYAIGLQKEAERLENQLGRRLTAEDLSGSTRVLTQEQIRRLQLAGVREADDINFVYGVNGTNPTLRNVFGRRSMAITFQFSSYYGKEMAWLHRNATRGRRKDPGLFLRYVEILGALTHLLERADIEGDEFNVFSDVLEIKDRFTEHGDLPLLGPVPNMITQLTIATTSTDPKRAEQAWDDFFYSASRATPLIQTLEKELRAAQQMIQGARVNPYSDETLRPFKDSETLSLALGTESVTNSRAKRFERDLRRIERRRSWEAHKIAREYVDAWKQNDADGMEVALEKARALGINPVDGIQNEIKKTAFSRLFRMIESSDANFTTKIYMDQMRREMPEAFDERQAERLRKFMEKRQRDFLDAAQQLQNKSPEDIERDRLRRKYILNERIRRETE